LYVGMVLDSVENAREVVKAYAIQHNFALKNGLVKNKDTTLLLLCKCALKTFNSRKLPLQKGVIGDNNLVRQKDARSMLCDCPWRVRFKKQLNGSWIVTELRDEHLGHQLEGVDPLSYSVNRPVTAEARATMFELVRDSSTTLNTVASMLNKTYGLSLLPRDVYNRTYDHGQRHGSSTVKFLEKLDQDGYLYRVR
ncbi:hypothetical protein V1521DRAFT_346699, partial [Lipomyces starkeyi]